MVPKILQIHRPSSGSSSKQRAEVTARPLGGSGDRTHRRFDKGGKLRNKKMAGWWLSPTPPKNMSSSVGMMTFPIEWKK